MTLFFLEPSEMSEVVLHQGSAPQECWDKRVNLQMFQLTNCLGGCLGKFIQGEMTFGATIAELHCDMQSRNKWIAKFFGPSLLDSASGLIANGK